MYLIGFFVIVIATCIVVRVVRVLLNKTKHARLMAKYNDVVLVARLMRREFWVGESAEQLRDSLGPPADIDERVLKSKVKRIWKYKCTGINRYGVKITVENDVVVGWHING